RTYYNKDGTTINLNFTFERDFTSNLLSFKTRTASELVIEAGEPTEIWILDLNQLRPYFKSYPDLEKFVKRLALRLLLASESYSNLFKISTPAERYKYVEQNNPRLLQRIPLSQIASYLGVSRETISRIRSREIL
ncbi:MAG: Crp/Fnr family transcriptional regulator, partial [Flavipsychrobacter sp.]